MSIEQCSSLVKSIEQCSSLVKSIEQCSSLVKFGTVNNSDLCSTVKPCYSLGNVKLY